MSDSNSDSLLQSRMFHNLLGQNVLQILKCAICLEFYEVPIILPCGHTFCFNCLMEMGKHASRNRPHVAVQNITIGCPNCRCNIYVMALIKRDITLNYPIQSLIEGLKSRKAPKMEDVACGPAEDVVSTGRRNTSVTEVTMAEVTQELDRLEEALKGGSVIADAFLAIDRIRSEHLLEEKNSMVGRTWRQPGLLMLEHCKDRNRNNATFRPFPSSAAGTSVPHRPRLDTLTTAAHSQSSTSNPAAPARPRWGRRAARQQREEKGADVSCADPAIVSYSLTADCLEPDLKQLVKGSRNGLGLGDKRGPQMQQSC